MGERMTEEALHHFHVPMTTGSDKWPSGFAPYTGICTSFKEPVD